MNIKSFMGVKSLRGFLYPILIVALLSAVSLRLNIRDTELSADWGKAVRTGDLKTRLWEDAVKTAVQEEVAFRGPAYAFLMAALLGTWLVKRKTGRTPLIARCVDGVPIHDIIAWIIAIAGTYIWAVGIHPYPLPTFAMGLIFIWVMMKTRNILWSITVHAFINACVIMGARFGGTLLY